MKLFVDEAADGESASEAGRRNVRDLERRMREAVKCLDFELAAELRDTINGLRGQVNGHSGSSVDKNKRRPSAQFKKYRRRSAKK
ncbi:MAG: UvrB/UvrC motif-containing protein [Synergistaceae bacterium]|nr:UvrB/UvrC motif-containing protein [Synergistaceae bacterium]